MVEAVISEAKGDSAKEVKLKLKADADADFNGPIRIVGGKEENPEGVASAPLTTFKTRTENLWLTVTPAPDAGAEDDPKQEGE